VRGFLTQEISMKFTLLATLAIFALASVTRRPALEKRSGDVVEEGISPPNNSVLQALLMHAFALLHLGKELSRTWMKPKSSLF
jgi:hypothetical protein